MTRLRCLFGIGVVFACVALALPALGQEKKGTDKKRAQPGAKGLQGKGFQFGGRAQGPLVSDAVQEKLKLTDEQKLKVSKLEIEYKYKNKVFTDKLTDLRKQFQDKNLEAIKELGEQMKVAQQLRGDYQKKVTEVLTEAQKTAYEEATKNQRAGFGGGGGFGRPTGPAQILSPALQERLNLSQEQKDKLAKIQKDAESKLMDVLTTEQKKQLDELKKAPQVQPRPKGAKNVSAEVELLRQTIPQIRALKALNREE